MKKKIYINNVNPRPKKMFQEAEKKKRSSSRVE
jgi:hypothetical protein